MTDLRGLVRRYGVPPKHCAPAELGAGPAGKDVKTGVQELMNRPPSRELDLPKKTGEQAKRLLRKLGIEPM